MIRATAYYSGTVQGVGFRYTTCRVAERFNVTGHVRNLPDGRVELIAEGDADEVDRFLAAVADAMARNIRTARIDRGETSGQFERFGITS